MNWNRKDLSIHSHTKMRSERLQLLFLLAAEKELKTTTKFPLATELIKYYQQRDKTGNTTSTRVTVRSIEGEGLIHNNGKIHIPPALRLRVLDLYHTMFVHPGETRMEKSIKLVYSWKGMRRDVQQQCKHYKTCQLFFENQEGKGMGCSQLRLLEPPSRKE